MLKIFLTVSFLFLTACPSMGTFPVTSYFEVDTDNMVCGEYKLMNAEAITFRHVRDHNISKCNGVFGAASHEVKPTIRWVREAIQKGKQNSKTAGANDNQTFNVSPDEDERD